MNRASSPAHASGSLNAARAFFARAAATKANGVGINVLWHDDFGERVLLRAHEDAEVIVLAAHGLGAARHTERAKRHAMGAKSLTKIDAELCKLIDAAGFTEDEANAMISHRPARTLSTNDSLLDPHARGLLFQLIDDVVALREAWSGVGSTAVAGRQGHKDIDDEHTARVALVAQFVAVTTGACATAAPAALAEIALGLAYPCGRVAAFEVRRDIWKRRLREGGARSRSRHAQAPE
jgi:hypothetical protein